MSARVPRRGESLNDHNRLFGWSFLHTANRDLKHHGQCGRQPAVIDPQAWLSPTSLSFGTQAVNTSATKTVTLQHPGTTALSLTGMTVTGANAAQFTFAPPRTAGVRSPPAAVVALNVSFKFKPVAKVAYSAALNLTDNAQLGHADCAVAWQTAAATLRQSELARHVELRVVSPGAFCDPSFSLTPKASGPLTGSVTPIDDGFDGTTQTVPLTATDIGLSQSITFQHAPKPVGTNHGPSLRPLKAAGRAMNDEGAGPSREVSGCAKARGNHNDWTRWCAGGSRATGLRC